MPSACLLRFDRKAAAPAYADALDVAANLSPQAPVFCFSAKLLTAQAREFLDRFPGEVAFAVKSNPAAQVIATLARAGIGVWDVASVHEMAAVRACARRAVFHYHNPVKSRAEIAEAFGRYGCRRFAADAIEEIDKIAAATGKAQGIEIAVRFVLPRQGRSSAHDFSSKFGVGEAEAAALLREAAGRGFEPVLTFHPGSQCKDPKAYARHIQAAARIANAAGVALHSLNVGGGFPARYVGSEGAELGEYFREIEAAMVLAFLGGAVPRLECEPGRALAATSTSLLTRVKLVREGRGDVFINDGVYGALMECWQVPELMPPARAIRDGKVLAGTTKAFTVYGPTCDPLDVLPVRLELPADIAEGDFIEFGTLGAYGLATMTRFNGYGGHETVAVERTLSL